MTIRKITELFRGRLREIGGETVRYLIAGTMTTLVNYLLFTLMTEVMGIADTVSEVTAVSISILFAYVVNKFFVFRRRCETMGELFFEFVKFISSRLLTMALEVGAFLLFVNVFGQSGQIGKIGSQALAIIANYPLSKLIVFHKRH